MSHEFTPTPAALTTLTLPDDDEDDAKDAASVNVPFVALGNATTRLQNLGLITGAPGGTDGTNALVLSFAEGALYGFRKRVFSDAIDPTPGTGSLDTAGSSATPAEAAYDEYFLTGNLATDGPVHLQIDIVTANNANQHGRTIKIVRRTTEDDLSDWAMGGNAIVTIEYLVDGAGSPVEVATLGLQDPTDSMGVTLGEALGIGWGWVELTFVPSLSRWRCTAWGGGGRPVYA